MAEHPLDKRATVVRFRVSLPMALWSNGYDFPLSPGRSGFNSPWGRQGVSSNGKDLRFSSERSGFESPYAHHSTRLPARSWQAKRLVV